MPTPDYNAHHKARSHNSRLIRQRIGKNFTVENDRNIQTDGHMQPPSTPINPKLKSNVS